MPKPSVARRFADLPTRVQAIVNEETDAAVLRFPDTQINVAAFQHQLMNGVHSRHVAHTRFAVFWRLWEDNKTRDRKLSKAAIARMFGMNHTSIIHGIRSHETMLSEWSDAKQRLYQTRRPTVERVAA